MQPSGTDRERPPVVLTVGFRLGSHRTLSLTEGNDPPLGLRPYANGALTGTKISASRISGDEAADRHAPRTSSLVFLAATGAGPAERSRRHAPRTPTSAPPRTNPPRPASTATANVGRPVAALTSLGAGTALAEGTLAEGALEVGAPPPSMPALVKVAVRLSASAGRRQRPRWSVLGAPLSFQLGMVWIQMPSSWVSSTRSTSRERARSAGPPASRRRSPRPVV